MLCMLLRPRYYKPNANKYSIVAAQTHNPQFIINIVHITDFCSLGEANTSELESPRVEDTSKLMEYLEPM